MGTGQLKALSSALDCRARLRTLPAFMLRRLPARLRLPLRRTEDFFLRVLDRENWMLLEPFTTADPPPVVEPAEELERCMLLMLLASLVWLFVMARGLGPFMMELPRWLASHSSVNFPVGLAGAGAYRCA